jgi:hypothetical protein
MCLYNGRVVKPLSCQGLVFWSMNVNKRGPALAACGLKLTRMFAYHFGLCGITCNHAHGDISLTINIVIKSLQP